ncbi:MAG: serine hydrolase [Minisyncoccia bacterium]
MAKSKDEISRKQSGRFARTLALAVGGVVAAILMVGTGTYFATKIYYENLLALAHPIFVPSSPYKLLHPIIGISLPGDQFGNGFPDVRSEIQSSVSALPAGTVTRYAVYLRDLNSGKWEGINENDLYDPASMLKVVVAIAAYRQAEQQPEFLSTPLTYTPALAQINAQLAFALPSDLQVGQSYTVPALVEKELTDSDNGAVYTLLNSINQQVLDAVYGDLSIPSPSATSSVGYKISPREYSRFFRILYNGTLSLNWADSEQILEDLSQSTYTEGLAAGIPSGITVAHKYGEHVDGSNNVVNDVELSDCGIVYYTPRPYFLCAMTEGKNPTALDAVIAQISKLVYQKISAD